MLAVRPAPRWLVQTRTQQSFLLARNTRSSCWSSPSLACRLLSTSVKSNDGDKERHYKNLPVQLEATFYVPKERAEKSAVYMKGETRLERNSRTCPTRELYFLHTQWGRHKSPYRKFRHMGTLLWSAPFQRLLFPDLFCISTLSIALTYYNEFIVTCSENLVQLSMSPTAFAGVTTAIGILAGFRLNASVGRVTDGRKAWSDVNSATRDFARHVLMWMKYDPVAQARMLRLCQAFPIALIFYVNGKGNHHNMKRKAKKGEASFEDRVQAEFQAELYDVYYPSKKQYQNNHHPDDHLILQQDFERICRVRAQGGYTPLEIIKFMSETIAGASNCQRISPVYIRELDAQVQRLGLALGSTERILKTPLPTGFTRHSSRLLFIWSNCLPFALYPLLGPLGTLPTAVFTAYAVLGIEDISVQLEEPFDILPLREYSDSMYSGIKAIEQGFTPYQYGTSHVTDTRTKAINDEEIE